MIDLKNITVDISLRINILRYSAKKIIANHPPIYSTLNPETSSDSPSAKSKGLRFVSAKQLINQIVNKIIFPHRNHMLCCVNLIWLNENELDKITINKIIRKNDTSYEIIWATLRIEPRFEYFELADHPIIRIKYTDILDKIKNNRILCLLSNNVKLLNGMIVKIIIGMNKDKAGVE